MNKREWQQLTMVIKVLMLLYLTYVAYGALHVQSEGFTQSSGPLSNVYVINMKQRTDRYNSFLTKYKAAGLKTGALKKFEAVVGKDLDLDDVPLTDLAREELKDLYDHGYRTKHYQLTEGAIGCYLSHVGLWDRIYDNNEPLALIFEDDAAIPPNFKPLLDQAMYKMEQADPQWDVFVLDVLCRDCLPYYEDIIKVKKFYLLHAYIIRRRAIQKLKDADALFPIEQQIDWVLSKNSKLLNIYSVRNGIVKQGGFTTDIQKPLHIVKGGDPFEEVTG